MPWMLQIQRPQLQAVILFFTLLARVSSQASTGLSEQPPPEDVCTAEDSGHCAAADSSSSPAPGPSCGCGSLRRSDFALEPGTGSPSSSEPRPDRGNTGESEEEAGIIWLDGGAFLMGLVPEDEGDETIWPADREGPAHREVVGAFGLGAYEVSNARFDHFVRETGYVTEAERFGWSFAVEAFISEEVNASITQWVEAAPWWLPVTGADWRHPNGPDTSIEGVMDHPVTQVSLSDAQAFCSWSRPGGRVPLETEWEFAARGGRRQRRFPWGNSMLTGKLKNKHRMNIWQSEVDERLRKSGKVTNLYNYGNMSTTLVKEYYSAENTAEDGYRGTAPVNAFGPQNSQGFYNMVGNVWEWTASHWESLPQAPPVEPNSMVKKGGSFLCNPVTCNRFRCSARMLFTADSAASNVGFRCAYDRKASA